MAGVSALHRASGSHRRPTWPLALPIAAAAVAVALPAVGGSSPERPAHLVIGELFPNGQELLLALILLATARGVLLRRRVAYYVILLLTGLSALDALESWQLGRLALLTVALAAFVRYRGEFTTSPSRVRTAVRAGLITYGLAISYGLAVMILQWHQMTPDPTPADAGREILSGLTASGPGPVHFSGSADHWFEASLGVIGGGGLLAMLVMMLTPAPPPPPGSDRERAEAARLVDDQGSDTLAPFVLRSDKSYVFSPDRRAVIGYRVLFGVAVAGGDPAGDPRSYPAAVAEFAALAERSGWRMAVLGARADLLDLWRPYGLRSIEIGDEVLLSPKEFGLSGRSMRNVRQAVQRTRNAGVTAQVVREGDLTSDERTRLQSVAAEAMDGAEERGFSMNMDDLLTGRHASSVVVVARDADGAPIGFQRYLPSACGRRISLDAMRRLPGAPNGLNERMIVDVMEYARERGIEEVSLNFAAFRELFDTAERGPLEQGGYRLIHLLDRFIKVESLYLFNRKFRPRYVRRAVAFPSWTSLLTVGAALLTLEFGHRRPPRPEHTSAAPDQVPEDGYAPSSWRSAG
ncbi:bifunctional lysylphosphatidylglycerol flippase/synthetase MprF [Actinoallomurus rhizosphaericola]|uniref:bifunctional lysylphosphatidylglycerol flippase/synthetase MprF n=1 Tax=Actinoallomurus rhizosphaericola TaxID=2952536 RepID=UPI0020905DC3|nr:phosphatidylglycerol lysyltransferase domain-containing protein [Actinoallomurus rhizosphaericola]MCO5993992.1 phosphatidylglycerol lysyltransferase domain-containing protein [Actinoallomurus rhizosphaericola]